MCASTLWPQQLLTGSGPGGMVRIFNTDMAVLEMQDARKDLPCTVTPTKPVLGFDLRFHRLASNGARPTARFVVLSAGISVR